MPARRRPQKYVTVTPVAETPTLTLGGTTATVNEGSTVTLTSITGTAVDSDDTLTLTMTGMASDATSPNRRTTRCSTAPASR